MTMPSSTSPLSTPLQTRRWLYLALLTIGLLTGFGRAALSNQGYVITAAEPLVLGFVVLAVVLLLWLRPRPIPYFPGLLCLLLAFVGFWLASPRGGLWIANYILHDPSYGPYDGINFGSLTFLLPVGWICLARSVINWRIGIITYFLAGLLFVLINIAAGLFGPPGFGPGLMPPFLPVAVLLL